MKLHLRATGCHLPYYDHPHAVLPSTRPDISEHTPT